MYKEYLSRGGKLYENEFETELARITRMLEDRFWAPPPCHILKREALESLCRGRCHPSL